MQIESGQLIIPKEKIGIAFLLLKEWEKTKPGDRMVVIKPRRNPNKMIIEHRSRELWEIVDNVSLSI